MEKIRHNFKFNDGRTFEMLIVNTGDHVLTFTKSGYGNYFEYNCGGEYLSSFVDGKQNKDYPLEYVADIALHGDRDDLFWEHY